LLISPGDILQFDHGRQGQESGSCSSSEDAAWVTGKGDCDSHLISQFFKCFFLVGDFITRKSNEAPLS
jgi:hypothetical protein